MYKITKEEAREIVNKADPDKAIKESAMFRIYENIKFAAKRGRLEVKVKLDKEEQQFIDEIITSLELDSGFTVDFVLDKTKTLPLNTILVSWRI